LGGGKLKKLLLIFAVFYLLNGMGLAPDYGPTDYNVITSTLQGFIVINDIEIWDEPIVNGINNNTAFGICPSQDCDIIAVMYSDSCIGWSYSNLSNNQFFITVNFNDQVTADISYYPNPGDSVSINIFDTSEGIMYYGIRETEILPLSQALLDNINVIGDGDYFTGEGGCPIYNDLYFNPFSNYGDCSLCNNTYSFCACIDPEAMNYTSDAIVNDNTCEYGFHFTHNLSFGNNLIGLPGYFENSNTIDIMDNLISAGTNVNFILGQGVGLFNTIDGWSGNLNFVDPFSGYWINMSQSLDWEIYFELGSIESCDNYETSYGNNLLSFKWGSGNALTMDALGGEEFATENYSFILGQGVGLFNTIDGWAGNLNFLQEGMGYWVNILNSSLNFKWGFENCGNPPEFQSLNKANNIPIEFQFSQSTEQAFYLLKNIDKFNKKIEIGDYILAYNNNILVGSTIYNDNISVLPVMGKDNSINTIGYCEINDRPHLKYYDISNGDIVDLNFKLESFDNLKITNVDFETEFEKNFTHQFKLNPSYPNPFNPTITINYEINFNGEIEINIYDINGKLIDNLINTYQNKGHYDISWDGANFSSGTYFIRVDYKINNQTNHEIQKIVLLK
jgi:hypothetical protein